MKILLTCGIYLSLLFSSGCSVVMALHGHKDPNMNALTIGQDRNVVIKYLGNPKATKITPEGRIDFYKLAKGNDANPALAVTDAGLDFLSFGAWEVIGTTSEALTTRSFNLAIQYDKNDKFIKIINENIQSHGLN